MNILDEIVGVEEASRLWHLSPGHIKNLCAQGKIKAKKIGKTWVLLKNQDHPSMIKNNHREIIK
jgi:hypothetical protein